MRTLAVLVMALGITAGWGEAAISFVTIMLSANEIMSEE